MVYAGVVELLVNLILIFVSCVILVLILEKVKPNPYVRQPHLVKVIWKIGISIGYGLSALVLLVTLASLIPYRLNLITLFIKVAILFINVIIFILLLLSLIDVRKATLINNYNERIRQRKKK